MTDFDETVLAEVFDRAMMRSLGVKRHRIDQSLHRLEVTGRVRRSDDWPALWTVAQELPCARTMFDKIESALELLSDVMRSPAWAAVSREVQHAVEHATVELQRGIGEI